MAIDQDREPTYADGFDTWWAEVLEVAQAYICEVLDEVTSQARAEVTATAAALARRENEVNAIAAALAEQAEELDGEAATLADLVRSAEERERMAEQRLMQAERTNVDATHALSQAMARSAALVAETENRIAERQTEAESLVRRMIEDATARANDIVASALASTDYSRAALRDLATSIEEFLSSDRFEAVKAGEAGDAMEVVNAGEAGQAGEADQADQADQAGGATIDLREDATPGPDDSPACPDDAAEPTAHRVSDAVHRAVRGWESEREQTR